MLAEQTELSMCVPNYLKVSHFTRLGKLFLFIQTQTAFDNLH